MDVVLCEVALRPATQADREFLIGVYGSVRAEELVQVAWTDTQQDAFVRMQFDVQDRQYRAANPDASFDVVEVDGRPAGRLYVDRRVDDIRIVEIALLPELRGRGIGSRLIRGLLDEAADSGRRVSLHVEVHNRAADLYTRLGFVPVAERGVHRLMEWKAP
jgi:ribosomal protein S18 acetylase RimI-like enzyme